MLSADNALTPKHNILCVQHASDLIYTHWTRCSVSIFLSDSCLVICLWSLVLFIHWVCTVRCALHILRLIMFSWTGSYVFTNVENNGYFHFVLFFVFNFHLTFSWSIYCEYPDSDRWMHRCHDIHESRLCISSIEFCNSIACHVHCTQLYITHLRKGNNLTENNWVSYTIALAHIVVSLLINKKKKIKFALFTCYTQNIHHNIGKYKYLSGALCDTRICVNR